MVMLRSNTVIWVALLAGSLVISGCKKKEGATAKASGAKESAKPGKEALPAFSGKLTYDLLKKVNRKLMLYNADGTAADFAPVLAKAKRMLGKPTHVAKNTYAWGFVKGDYCHYYPLTNKKGKVEGLGAVREALFGKKEGDCMEALGKAVAKPKVTVAPPPKKGPVKPSMVVAAAKAKSAAWIGKKLVVQGLYFGTNTMTANGKKSVKLSLIDSKDNTKDSVDCTLVAGSKPLVLKQYMPIKVIGTMTDNSWAELKDCGLVVK
jgi:hypothetical protein